MVIFAFCLANMESKNIFNVFVINWGDTSGFNEKHK